MDKQVVCPVGTISEAAEIIRLGGLVAFPTETVYGLGADATNASAVAKIFARKGRPTFNPLIVHVGTPDAANGLWQEFPELARILIGRFWPGPLTIVLPKKSVIPDIVTAGLSTVAIRMPSHPIALELIREAGRPIAAPSANLFGRPSATTARAVLDDFGESIDMILDGGPTTLGLESTVVTFKGNRVIILRPGAITLEQLRGVGVSVTYAEPKDGEVLSPGMLSKHYAPATPLFILPHRRAYHSLAAPRPRPPHQRTATPPSTTPPSARSLVAHTARVSEESGILNQGKSALLSLDGNLEGIQIEEFAHVEILSKQGNLVEAAAKFFETIRKLDAMHFSAIVAIPVEEKGLGVALMDRLRRGSQSAN